MLVCELPTTSENVNDDQPTHECSPLLEHMCGVFDKSQISNDIEGVDRVYGEIADNEIYVVKGGLLSHRSLSLYASLPLRTNALSEYDTLVNGMISFGLFPWPLHPFDPGVLVGWEGIVLACPYFPLMFTLSLSFVMHILIIS